MTWFSSLILGLVQGLTEYLPVSSSGHLELGKALLGVDDGGLAFDVLVHVATVCSTIVVLRKELWQLICGVLKWQWNVETRYVVAIIVSMIPIGLVGFCLKDRVEALYSSRVLTVVGGCLIITSLLLAMTHFYPNGFRRGRQGGMNMWQALVVGVAQACAVLPGLSRSGSTIATGLLLGVDRKVIAKFSFLMVLPPILGEALLDSRHLVAGDEVSTLSLGAVIIGFVAAFVSGCIACQWMIALVSKCKLIYFAIYTLIVGLLAIVLS